MTITTPTLIVTLVLVVLTFVLPRKHIISTFAVAAVFIPVDQRILVGGLDFPVLRILILVAFLRILASGEKLSISWNRLDKVLAAWALCGAIVYIIKWRNSAAVINRLGFLYEVLGFYWICRHSIRSFEDIKAVIKGFALCSLILVPFVFVEWTTGKNAFVIFGRTWTSFREGAYRCQAAFPHSIMFGVFWATLNPMFIALAIAEKNKSLPVAAVIASAFMVWASSSSTPVGALLAILLLFFFFQLRQYGRYAALGLLGLATALHLMMEAPVWHLLARIRLIGGSTGYHRFKLIDETIKNFNDWWLVGAGDTNAWSRAHHLFDITNQYCLEAIRGGLWTLILFVLLLIMTVRTVAGYSMQNISRGHQWIAWGICAAIIGHCISFIGVSYFGQMRVILFLTFALTGTIYDMSKAPAPVIKIVRKRKIPSRMLSVNQAK
ncbi:MAG: hypothetical protein JW804_04860 [Sedimentisphaerales bacterium]|nr:hypothetical protein [Sedimentisphaerales bacterium]